MREVDQDTDLGAEGGNNEKFLCLKVQIKITTKEASSDIPVLDICSFR